MPPPDLSWGPRQCVWAIKSGKKVVMSPCKVFACVLTSLMVKAVGVESADLTLLNQLSFGRMEKVPPYGLFGGPRQWGWGISA